ncbi:hypothetical protein EVAR_70952_1 [Eumeta japonica]|uniref:Integrase catalytic domain-containing protein n=1 Tax=Eumeta variegata TaxID=151549 RepID=A0A4C1ZXX1_EUMVA|nr:hypothetical protein EVAR_70952_1 [Eumeta japonica]
MSARGPSQFSNPMKIMGIKKNRTTAYPPQSNGIVERWHRKTALRAKLSNSNTWIDELPTVLLGLRATLRTDAEVSLAELIYEYNLRLPGYFFNKCATYKHDELKLRRKTATLLIHSNDGPLWDKHFGMRTERCREMWWHSALFLNNFSNWADCIPQACFGFGHAFDSDPGLNFDSAFCPALSVH